MATHSTTNYNSVAVATSPKSKAQRVEDGRNSPDTTEADLLHPFFVSTHRFEREFEQMEQLGQGGFGQVILARNRLDGRPYAIKRIALSILSRSKSDETLQKVRPTSWRHPITD